MDSSILNTIKFNANAYWICEFTLIIVLARNVKGEVLGMWYENYECSLVVIAKLLSI